MTWRPAHGASWSMVADGLLTRQRYREVPPRVDYELTERSRDLMPVLGALAQWGYDWTWTAPRAGEDVNVGAIFRLAPGLLEPPECRVNRARRVAGDVDYLEPMAMAARDGLQDEGGGERDPHDYVDNVRRMRRQIPPAGS